MLKQNQLYNKKNRCAALRGWHCDCTFHTTYNWSPISLISQCKDKFLVKLKPNCNVRWRCTVSFPEWHVCVFNRTNQIERKSSANRNRNRNEPGQWKSGLLSQLLRSALAVKSLTIDSIPLGAFYSWSTLSSRMKALLCSIFLAVLLLQLASSYKIPQDLKVKHDHLSFQ